MGKRYQCDYCDRSFQDTLHNRKKHLNGVQHQRAKKTWFNNFRDAAEILQEENNKQSCRKFLQTGQCVFGPSCRYSHMSEQEIRNLERLINDERGLDEGTLTTGTGPLEDWLSRRETRETRTVMSSGSAYKVEEERAAEDNDVPEFLLCVPDLPVSLLPPRSGGLNCSVYNHWG